MAGVSGSYRALAQMRRRMLVNSLRTPRGKIELVTRLFAIAAFSLISLAVSIACGFQARQFAAADNLKMLPILLWPISAAWLLLPFLLGPFGETPDLTFLLRFPVSFNSYLRLSLLSGLFDPSSLLGGMALLGVGFGTVSAQPQLLAWITVSLSLFAIFNFLLSKTVVACLNRWLSQRHAKIILAIALLLLLSLTLLRPSAPRFWLPPDLVANSIELPAEGHALRALLPLSLLALYGLLVGTLLRRRLRAEFRGESLAASPRIVNRSKAPALPQPATPTRSSPLSAVVRKELRYLSRSGHMIFLLTLPPLLLWFTSRSLQTKPGPLVPYMLPLWTALAFMPLTRQVCNSLGSESAGIQLYFLSPTPFRTVMLGKNLLHLALFGLESTVVCCIVFLRLGMPSPQIIVATFCWLLFALPLQLAVGNLLSITMPYRMTLTRVSSEQGATGNGLLSLLLQFLLLGVGSAVYFSPAAVRRAAPPDVILLLLAVIGAFFWLLVLSRVDSIAVNRRTELLARLVRVA